MGIKKVQYKLCVMPRNRRFSEALRKPFNAKKGTQLLFLGIIKVITDGIEAHLSNPLKTHQGLITQTSSEPELYSLNVSLFLVRNLSPLSTFSHPLINSAPCRF